MSRYDRYRNRHYGYHHPHRGRRYGRRRRDTAGTFLIVLFVLMALFSMGRQADEPPQRVASVGPAGPLQDRQQVGPPELESVAPPPIAPPVPGESPEIAEAADAAPMQRMPTIETSEGDSAVPAGCDSAGCRIEFAAYGGAKAGKAFALSGAGQGFWAAGEESVSVAARRALQSCHESSGQPCEIKAVQGGKS